MPISCPLCSLSIGPQRNYRAVPATMKRQLLRNAYAVRLKMTKSLFTEMITSQWEINIGWTMVLSPQHRSLTLMRSRSLPWLRLVCEVHCPHRPWANAQTWLLETILDQIGSLYVKELRTMEHHGLVSSISNMSSSEWYSFSFALWRYSEQDSWSCTLKLTLQVRSLSYLYLSIESAARRKLMTNPTNPSIAFPRIWSSVVHLILLFPQMAPNPDNEPSVVS